jgi:hypothetical protein
MMKREKERVDSSFRWNDNGRATPLKLLAKGEKSIVAGGRSF